MSRLEDGYLDHVLPHESHRVDWQPFAGDSIRDQQKTFEKQRHQPYNSLCKNNSDYELQSIMLDPTSIASEYKHILKH